MGRIRSLSTRSVDFARYSSIKIGPKVDVVVIREIDPDFDSFFIVGGANNLLVSPTPPPLALLGKEFDYIRWEGDRLVVGGGTSTGRLLSFAKSHNIGGFEFLAKLPGKIGGAIKMNAGLKGYEIGDLLLSVRTARGTIPKEELDLGYRRSGIKEIVYEALFQVREGYREGLRRELLKLRSNQPKEPSAGSCFKNPPNDYAGRLIEAVGLKGARIGGAAFSPIHANFLVNMGGATFEDARKLMELAQKRVYEEFGIWLEEEIVTV
ncbi:MAG: UDP-N-acetylmuramate dehydrogenase [Epsilonproteobacteria bacterium]|nr:UDP-N-acetylmuramate dehydrogenase [Campylobacterota bacterium]NPA57118.1 UDP-N-acetylmuramate dehydrogenase [Campylobacterota bacterium]